MAFVIYFGVFNKNKFMKNKTYMLEFINIPDKYLDVKKINMIIMNIGYIMKLLINILILIQIKFLLLLYSIK